MENYEREDAFFDVVKKNKEMHDSENQITADIARNVNAYYKNISRAKAAVKRDEEIKRVIDRKKRVRVMAITGAILAVLAAGITVSIEYGDEISTSISMRNDYEHAVKILDKNILMVFNARQLSNGPLLNDNTLQQYKNLNITTIEEVYMYRYESSISMSDNFEKEFDKLIRSVSYYDEEGKICFYTSFENFLEVNGFNEEEFKQVAKESIVAKYRAGEIKELLYEGVGTVNMPVGKGK